MTTLASLLEAMRVDTRWIETIRVDARWVERMIQDLEAIQPETSEAPQAHLPYLDVLKFIAEVDAYAAESERKGNAMNEIDHVLFKGTLTKFAAVTKAILTEWDGLISNFDLWIASYAAGSSERLKSLKPGVRLVQDDSNLEVASWVKLLYYMPLEQSRSYGNYGKVVATHLPEGSTRLRIYADPEYQYEMTKQWGRLTEELAAQGWIMPPQVATQKARHEAAERRMNEWGETPFTAFDEFIATSCDDLFGTQSSQGVIPGWLFNYWRDREDRPAPVFSRMGCMAHIYMRGLPVIGVEALEDNTAGNAQVIVRVSGNGEDESFFHELYRTSREVGQALGEYLKRRYLAGVSGGVGVSVETPPKDNNMHRGDDLDSLICLIQEKRLGRRPESDLEMAAAWLAWQMTPKQARGKRLRWLEEKFGTNVHGVSNVLESNFDNYKRKVPAERLQILKEI